MIKKKILILTIQLNGKAIWRCSNDSCNRYQLKQSKYTKDLWICGKCNEMYYINKCKVVEERKQKDRRNKK